MTSASPLPPLAFAATCTLVLLRLPPTPPTPLTHPRALSCLVPEQKLEKMVNVALVVIFIALILLCIAATFLTSQQKYKYSKAWYARPVTPAPAGAPAVCPAVRVRLQTCARHRESRVRPNATTAAARAAVASALIRGGGWQSCVCCAHAHARLCVRAYVSALYPVGRAQVP